MRGVLLGAALALAASAQTRGGISTREFAISDSPCEHRHVPAVERALQILVSAGPASTVELRNVSAKAITAFVYTARKGATIWYSDSGEDFVSDMALGRSPAFPPGGVLRRKLGTGRQWEVFPCAVIFEDGTAAGPPHVLSSIAQSRSALADELAALIPELDSALNSADPGATLAMRVRQLKRRGATRGSYAYLELVAGELSGTDGAARAIIAEHGSTLRAERDALVRLGVSGAPDRRAPAPAARR